MDNRLLSIITSLTVIAYTLIVYAFEFVPQDIEIGYYDNFQFFVLMISREVGVIFLCGVIIVFTKNSVIITYGCIAIICVNAMSILDEVYGWDNITVWPVLIVTAFILGAFSFVLKIANILVVSKDAYISLQNDIVNDTVKNIEEELESLNERKKVGEISPTEYRGAMLSLHKAITNCHTD